MSMPVKLFRSIFILVVPVCLLSASATQHVITPSPAFNADQLRASPSADWITNGGNIFNHRYSPLAELTAGNVAGLKAVWRTSLLGSGTGSRYSNQTQLLAYKGTLYAITGQNDVFAIDIDSGDIVWKYTSGLTTGDVNLCCGWVARGVAMGGGKIFLGRLDAKLIALDQKTGRVVWSVQAEDPGVGYSITSAPLYYDGKVITGFAGGEFGIRGRVKAFDATDGSLLWTFYTIPGPGETGHDSWPQNNDAWQRGGAPVWQTPAVDSELGLLYFSTGNPAPDLNGGDRAGDNLFSDSIVAIDVNTGAYRWHFQQVRHDIWDYDSPNPVILFDAAFNGVMRKGIAEVSKSGYLYILNRETGEPLVPVNYMTVPQDASQHTASTQPIPQGDDIIAHSIDTAPQGWTLVNNAATFTPFGATATLYTPLAGVNWPPSSYDPESSLMYICANENLVAAYAIDLMGQGPVPPMQWLGGLWTFPGVPGKGVFAAVDLKTNRLAWRREWNYRCYSGSVVTKGGLVFVGLSDGRLTAMDKRNGNLLWQFQTDGGVNTTVTIFEHNGRENIAVLAGGTLAGNTKRNDGIWLFSLDGKIESLPSINGLTPDEMRKRSILIFLNQINDG